MHNLFPVLEVEHLVRSGSNHTPLLITFKADEERRVGPFKFLNFWVEEETFKEVVKQNWTTDFERDPFSLFHHKLKRVKKALALWSKSTFENIFQEIIILEEVIKVQEIQFERDLTGANKEVLHKSQSELKKQFHREEEFWKQKAGIQWFKDGECNTKFFHTIFKGIRNI